MKFSKAYEPDQFEPDIYALWEKSGAFKPSTEKGKDPYTNWFYGKPSSRDRQGICRLGVS